MVKLVDDTQQQFRHELSSFTRTLIYIVAVVVLLAALFCMLAIFRISSFAFQTYDSYQNIPFNKVGVLLGTSPNVAPGQDNHYFTYRIMAATELYNSGRIEYILVSGDNRHDSYNEPRMMYRALVKNGIPPEKITMDFAGINTLNSVVRASRVFMLPNMTIISQGFQNERALFIADHFGIRAIAYNATDPETGWDSLKVTLREFAARIKCILDVYFFDTQPKFLGKPIRIGDIMMPKLPSNKPRHPTSKPKRPGLSIAGLKAIGKQVPKLRLPQNTAEPELSEDELNAHKLPEPAQGDAAQPQDSTAAERALESSRALAQQALTQPEPAAAHNLPRPEAAAQRAQPAETKVVSAHRDRVPDASETLTPVDAAEVDRAEHGAKPLEDLSRAGAQLTPESDTVPDNGAENVQAPALTEEQLNNLKLQEAILRQEQVKALTDAVEAASESLNTGTSSTYIDPNIAEEHEMMEREAEQEQAE
ncbi:MAG: YdcF family protein [Succinivibrio sp.]|nr:YdcF family protein [Succinivibrio sp.]